MKQDNKQVTDTSKAIKFDFNNPIPKFEIDVLSKEDTGSKRLTKFKYKDKFYSQVYNYGKGYGFKFIWEFDTKEQQDNHLRQTGGQQIYSSTLESDCSPFGVYLEYSLMKTGALSNTPTEHPQPTDTANTVSSEVNFDEWEIMGRQVNGNFQRGIWYKNKSGDKIAAVYGETAQEAEANAQRIVQAVNSFDAMYNALVTLQSNFQANKNFGTTPNKQELEAGLNIINATLNNISNK